MNSFDRLPAVLQPLIEIIAVEGQSHAHNGIEHPEHVGIVIVNGHVATYLTEVEAVAPHLYQTDDLEGDDVKDEDRQCVLAAIDEETANDIVVLVYLCGHIIGHKEAAYGRYGKFEETAEGRVPRHASKRILREKSNHGETEQAYPPPHVQPLLILTDEEAHTEEHGTYHIAIATLRQAVDIELATCLPRGEEQHQHAYRDADAHVRMVLVAGMHPTYLRQELEEDEI